MNINFSVLKELGLTEYESKCLTVLLSYGKLPAREVAKRAGISSAPVYETLRSLAQRGLVQQVSNDPLTYVAIDPKLSLPKFLEDKKKYVDQIGNTALKLLTNIKQIAGSSEASVESLKVYFGSDYRFSVGLPLYSLAKREIFALTRSDSLPVEHFREINKAIKRGVDYKLIATQRSATNESVIKKYLHLGAKVKLNRKLHGYHLLLFDRKIALIILFGEKNNVAIAVLKNPGLCAGLAQYLETVWKDSELVA